MCFKETTTTTFISTLAIRCTVDDDDGVEVLKCKDARTGMIQRRIC
jgi:hypothetical protein